MKTDLTSQDIKDIFGNFSELPFLKDPFGILAIVNYDEFLGTKSKIKQPEYESHIIQPEAENEITQHEPEITNIDDKPFSKIIIDSKYYKAGEALLFDNQFTFNHRKDEKWGNLGEIKEEKSKVIYKKGALFCIEVDNNQWTPLNASYDDYRNPYLDSTTHDLF